MQKLRYSQNTIMFYKYYTGSLRTEVIFFTALQIIHLWESDVTFCGYLCGNRLQSFADKFMFKSPCVAAHMRGMRPTPTAKKDTLMLKRNSNILLFLLNFHYNSIMYFNCCAYIRIRTYYVSLTMHINLGTYLYGTKLIQTRTETLRNKRVFTEYYYSNRCYILY